MSGKFGRTYVMTVQVDDASQPNNTVVISYPLTLELEIVRGVQASANLGHFRIFNLSPETRKRIFHDRTDVTKYRKVTLSAGYESDKKLTLIFQGNMFMASSYRSGPDWITDIEAYSGLYGIQNAQASFTKPSGYNLKDIITTALQSFSNYGITIGAVDNFLTDQNSRAITVAGNTWDEISKLAPSADRFIDNEKAYVVQKDTVVNPASGIALINADTGLLNTPRRYDGRLDVPILFEPRIQVGQQIQLVSAESVYNGTYKVSGIEHRGIISGAVNGDLQTKLVIWTSTTVLGQTVGAGV